jgi:hypothetical protein
MEGLARMNARRPRTIRAASQLVKEISVVPILHCQGKATLLLLIDRASTHHPQKDAAVYRVENEYDTV